MKSKFISQGRLPLTLCFIWNSYLVITLMSYDFNDAIRIHGAISFGEILVWILYNLVAIIIVSALPVLIVFWKWKNNREGLITTGLIMLFVTGVLGKEFLFQTDPSRGFILVLNWLVIWILTAILIVIPNRRNSNE